MKEENKNVTEKEGPGWSEIIKKCKDFTWNTKVRTCKNRNNYWYRKFKTIWEKWERCLCKTKKYTQKKKKKKEKKKKQKKTEKNRKKNKKNKREVDTIKMKEVPARC